MNHRKELLRGLWVYHATEELVAPKMEEAPPPPEAGQATEGF